jgi:hypothetical protein
MPIGVECNTGDLAASYFGQNGAGGRALISIAIANVSDQACDLPSVWFEALGEDGSIFGQAGFPRDLKLPLAPTHAPAAREQVAGVAVITLAYASRCESVYPNCEGTEIIGFAVHFKDGRIIAVPVLEEHPSAQPGGLSFMWAHLITES